MKQWLMAAILGLASVGAGAGTARAQAAVLRPDRELSPAEDSLRSALYQLRDTLAVLSGSMARMERDFRATSNAALASRAREVHRSCAMSDRNLPGTTVAVKAFPEGTRLQEDQRQRLLGALVQLHEALADCSSWFESRVVPSRADDVRGYGNARLEPVRRELRRYESAVDGYFRALWIPNRPLGAKPNPIIG